MPGKTKSDLQRIHAHIASAAAARKRLEQFTPAERSEQMRQVAKSLWDTKTPAQRRAHAQMMLKARYTNRAARATAK